MAQSFNPTEIWTPFGAFSMAVSQGTGQVVYLKGQVALDRNGRLIGKVDMRAQVRKTLENIAAVLASVGGNMSDVVSLTNYSTDIDAFMDSGDIRTEFFTDPYPVTTTVQVARLYDPDILIEITAIAEVPRDRWTGGQGTEP